MMLCITQQLERKVDQAEGRENGNENSNLPWGIWDMLNKPCFFKFYIKIPFIQSHISKR